MNKYARLAVSMVVPQLVALVGALATASSVKTWFVTLQKPFFNPPSWLFAPVWTTLYVLMGLACYLIWQKQQEHQQRNAQKRQALLWYALQLALNMLWSVIFFGLQSPFWALVVIVVLWLVIIICIRLFHSLNRLAAYFFMPLLLWVSFATVLNASIWFLN